MLWTLTRVPSMWHRIFGTLCHEMMGLSACSGLAPCSASDLPCGGRTAPPWNITGVLPKRAGGSAALLSTEADTPLKKPAGLTEFPVLLGSEGSHQSCVVLLDLCYSWFGCSCYCPNSLEAHSQETEFHIFCCTWVVRQANFSSKYLVKIRIR